MKRLVILPLLLVCSPVAALALASDTGGNALGTMQLGTYVCELPGDATGPAGVRVPQEDFAITNASSYEAEGGSGAYLLTGDTFVMTSGPRRGNRYHRQTSGFLRKLDASGAPGPLRCVKRSRNAG